MKGMDSISSQLIFEIQKAFYDERGKGARYRLTTIGVPYIKNLIGKELDNLETVKGFLIQKEMVTGLEIRDEDVSMDVTVSGCFFQKVRDLFTEAKMQPLSCPIANILMEVLERKSGLSPELLPIKIDGNICSLSMAKIATSDVVKE